MSFMKKFKICYYFLGLFILTTKSETSTPRTLEEENGKIFL